jgi:predicted PurR-regulated permease PerM
MTEFWDRRAKQFLAAACAVVLLFVFYKIAKYYFDIIAILGISVLISYLLIGPVDWLSRIVKFRSLAVVIVYLTLLGLFIALIVFVLPRVTNEFILFTKHLPETTALLDKKGDEFQVFLNKNNISVDIDSVVGSITYGITDKLSHSALDNINKVIEAAAGTVHAIFYILVTSVTSYYFLLDGHKLTYEFKKYIPKQHQHHVDNIAIELDRCLRGFYGGMVKLAGINAAVMFSTYIIMKVPYAFLLGIWHFLWCIIPVVGGWVGLVPALFVIAFTDPFQLWIPLVVYEGFTRLIKDNFITPKIMGDAIGIHPVLILIAVLAGLKTAGLVGVLFALPLFGVINVIFKYTLSQIKIDEFD